MLKLTVFLFALVVSTWVTDRARADSSSFPSVPARFRTSELTLGSRALGEVCYAFDEMPDGTVCNPAHLPNKDDSILLARVFIGNGYAALSSADQFVNKPLTKEYLQSLFQNRNATAVEANIGLNFTTRYFQAVFAPYRIQYASEVHNPNNPDVAVHAAIERAFVFSSGTSLIAASKDLRDFSVGTRVRILQRKFVHGQFSFLDVATKDPADFLPVRTQNAVLVDPVLTWIPGNQPWKLNVSLGAKNLGYSSGNYAEYPDAPDLGGGVGVEPPVKFGKLRIGLDFVDLINAPNPEDRLRFGTSYRLGLLDFMVGANSSSLTTGISFLLSFLQAGVVYEVARDDLDNGKQETRIATEINAHF